MKIGVDLVEIHRIAELSKNESFLHRVYSEKELSLIENTSETRLYEVLAGRFAAKEATLKAIGTGISHGISFKNIETLQGLYGEPVLNLSGRVLEIAQQYGLKTYHISLSHAGNLVTAFVVLE